MSLCGADEGRIADVDGIEETFGPRIRLHGFEHDGITIMPDEDGAGSQTIAGGQLHGEAIIFGDDDGGFDKAKAITVHRRRELRRSRPSRAGERKRGVILGRRMFAR